MGLTNEPQRFYVDSAASRGTLKLAVFINVVGGMWFKELTGTKVGGDTLKMGYLNTEGGEAKGLTKNEYMECVRAAEKHFLDTSPAFRRIKGNIYLVHDRSSTHPSKPIPGVSWTPVAHPPHSPDLMPLDYGIFGTAKQELDRSSTRAMPWADKVQLYKDILMAGPVTATINSYQARLQACIDAGGKHFRMSRRKRSDS